MAPMGCVRGIWMARGGSNSLPPLPTSVADLGDLDGPMTTRLAVTNGACAKYATLSYR